MNKNLVAIGIAFILICVGLSGCDESDDEEIKEPSIYCVMEAIAQVVNGTKDPQEGVSVSFHFQYEATTIKTVHLTTDSTGWTGFAVASVTLEDDKSAHCTVYLTDNEAIREFHSIYHSEVKYRDDDGLYYWSISPILVQK